MLPDVYRVDTAFGDDNVPARLFEAHLDLGRDSAMLKQAWHCSRCSLGWHQGLRVGIIIMSPLQGRYKNNEYNTQGQAPALGYIALTGH